MKILFVCTANINRSRTAEDLLKNSPHYEVKSAGIIEHPQGGQKLTEELIRWADRIFLMNENQDKHWSFLRENFRNAILDKDIYVLNIQDVYARGDRALINILKERLKALDIKFE